MKRLLLIIALCVVTQGQSVKQTGKPKPAASTDITEDILLGRTVRPDGLLTVTRNGGIICFYCVGKRNYSTIGFIRPEKLRIDRDLRSNHAQGQSKQTEFKLNPDASKLWANIDQAQSELRRQYEQLEAQRATLLIGAGVPQDSRSCKVDDKGIVICAKPEAAKASPEGKVKP